MKRFATTELDKSFVTMSFVEYVYGQYWILRKIDDVVTVKLVRVYDIEALKMKAQLYITQEPYPNHTRNY